MPRKRAHNRNNRSHKFSSTIAWRGIIAVQQQPSLGLLSLNFYFFFASILESQPSHDSPELRQHTKFQLGKNNFSKVQKFMRRVGSKVMSLSGVSIWLCAIEQLTTLRTLDDATRQWTHKVIKFYDFFMCFCRCWGCLRYVPFSSLFHRLTFLFDCMFGCWRLWVKEQQRIDTSVARYLCTVGAFEKGSGLN